MTREICDDRLILLTGATGYVGGRLLRVLEHQGHRVRCLARRAEFLKPKVSAGTEIVAGDVLDRASLGSALGGVSVAYYLVHSMGSSGSFEESDRRSARNFGAAAKAEGVELIIYLGALGNDGETLSPHLRSRQEVGQILRASGVPVIEFRASIVIGSSWLHCTNPKQQLDTTPRETYHNLLNSICGVIIVVENARRSLLLIVTNEARLKNKNFCSFQGLHPAFFSSTLSPFIF